mgnify:CR=1 FL=1
MFSKKDLQRLIVPLIIEQFLAITIGMADTVMVASCGEAAVSGVSLVDSINILLINICVGDRRRYHCLPVYRERADE